MVVVVRVRRGHAAAAAVAVDHKRPPVVAVVKHACHPQQHQDEGAEQEEEHVDTFGLRGQA